jgi:hypothetical protein
MKRASKCNGMYDRLVNSSQLIETCKSSKRENSFGQCQRDYTYIQQEKIRICPPTLAHLMNRFHHIKVFF